MTRWESVNKISVLDRDGWLCRYCRVALYIDDVPADRSDLRATLDHVVPVSLGGDHTYINVVVSCATCNSEKGNDPGMVDIFILLENILLEEATSE
jgi:5-methylcytosine-specific restriction endonuclease McrA